MWKNVTDRVSSFFAQQPIVGQGLLIIEASWSQTHYTR